MKRITLIALCMAMIAAVSCGNNPKKKASVQEAVQNSAEVMESAPAEAPAAKAEKQKADAKKWSEKSDFDSVDGAPYMEGKAFEVTAFSAEPTFEGLVVSLDGLTEIAK